MNNLKQAETKNGSFSPIEQGSKYLTKIRKLVLKFVKAKNNKWKGKDCDYMLLEPFNVNETVFERDGRVIISGEEDNDFSTYYVNYYSQVLADDFRQFLIENKVWTEWANAGALETVKGWEV